MITHISIRDFATIENTEIDFKEGLNVLTGETGAGKSIVIEAISLALGARADNTFVRTGSDKATVQMIAEHNKSEIIITRELSATGKNVCRIDDRIVTLGELAEVCSGIADIHGQYDNQSLLDVSNHIKLVDAYEKDSINPILKKVESLYEDYQKASRSLDEAQTAANYNEEQKELIAFQINEIEAARLISGEEESCREELLEMENNEKIYNAFDRAYAAAYSEEDAAVSKLDEVLAALRSVTQVSRDAAGLEDEISDMYYRFEDTANRLRDMRDNIVFNPGRIEELTDRLYEIDKLKKKYGDSIDEIFQTLDRLQNEFRRLQDIDSEIESMQIAKSRVEEMLKIESETLTRLRKSSAATLEDNIMAELENLNFKNAQISISFREMDDFTSTGRDKVEFLFSANVGEDLKPLSKIASGGEMSRVMLAFKKIIGEYDGIPTMIFDEIDSGLGGETAGVVAKELSAISKNHQLICITHLPQIAAAGDHNYRIEKTSDDAKTYTTVSLLSDDEKITEIARLLSGMNVSDITLANAQELIHLAAK